MIKRLFYRDAFSKIIKCIILLVLGVIIGYLALVFVYLLPPDVMEQHVKESYDMIREEGISPILINGYETTRLDNYSDGLILNNAIYDGQETVWEKAAAVYQYVYEGENYYVSLLRHFDNIPGEIKNSYERDWHGYLVYVKPLLLFMNYEDIRILNMVMQILIVLSLIHLMDKKGLGKYIPATMMLFVFLTWNILFYSIEYSALLYVIVFASIFIISNNHIIISKKTVPELFLIIGMIVSYIDVLTYPILTVGIPLIYMFLMNEDWNKRINEEIRHIFTVSISWICGYGGMWVGKWIIASIILKRNTIKEAILMALYRMSQTSGESGKIVEFTVKDVFVRNFSVYGHPPYIFALIFFLAYLLFMICRQGFYFNLKRTLPLLIIALMPIVWYLVVGNHSYIHYWMTHRNIVLTVFASCCIAIGLIKEKTKFETNL